MLEVLIVEDNKLIARTLVSVVERRLAWMPCCEGKGQRIHVVHSFQNAVALLEKRPLIDVVVSDYDLGNGRNGIDLLKQAKKIRPPARRVLFSGHPPRNCPDLLASGLLTRLAFKPDTDPIIEVIDELLARCCC